MSAAANALSDEECKRELLSLKCRGWWLRRNARLTRAQDELEKIKLHNVHAMLDGLFRKKLKSFWKGTNDSALHNNFCSSSLDLFDMSERTEIDSSDIQPGFQ